VFKIGTAACLSPCVLLASHLPLIGIGWITCGTVRLRVPDETQEDPGYRSKRTKLREQPIALDVWAICYHVRKRLTLLAARAASAFNRILEPWRVHRRIGGTCNCTTSA
jgi:hypothetical protein